jgi:hypothetical protein
MLRIITSVTCKKIKIYVFKIIFIIFIFSVLTSCATYQYKVTRIETDVSKLNQHEINKLAVIQILLVKQGELITGGSGFFVNTDGYIVTAFHIIEPAQNDYLIKIFINIYESLYIAKIVDFDQSKDLAILKVNTGIALPCVKFSNNSKNTNNKKITFLSFPPNWDTYKKGSYIPGSKQVEITNHHPINFTDIYDLLNNTDISNIFNEDELKNILNNPESSNHFSKSPFPDTSKYSEKTKQAFIFFLKDRESRLFFIDPYKKMLAGFSGGIWFNEQDYCIGIFQEIFVLFKPNPQSRYIHVNKPPADNYVFPIVDKMICAGQNSSKIMDFLYQKGIKYYQ